MKSTGILVVAAAVLWTGTAWAHAKLVSSMPAADAVTASPKEAVLTFNQAVKPLKCTLTDGAGQAIALPDPPYAVDAAVHCPIAATLPAGAYQLGWRVTTSDAHVVTGVVPFKVGP